jgi:wyosine [tRNA(Phe)-imidazoG37] synthetase (radical SAM superfamily)
MFAMNSRSTLDVTDHSRDSTGMTYVYPVVSRRAGGVSIGINLNPNNACNWRCIYCQVPGLVRGAAPPIDLPVLERELRQMLEEVVHGRFLQQRVAAPARHLEDIAFSGNGEPTGCAEFPHTLAIVENVLRDFGLSGKIKVRLITNGSLIDRPGVFDALAHLAGLNGEVWFKVDAATPAAIARINDVHLKPEGIVERLRNCAQACPTWVQTCLFALDGAPPDDREMQAYLDLLESVADKLSGVHLYGLARPSMQPEAPRLSRLSGEWMEMLADRVRATGLKVCVSP